MGADNGHPTSLPLTAIVVGERVRKDPGDIRSLAESIRRRGLLHALVITPDRRLVAGFRRIAAMRYLGWPESPVRVVDSLEDALSVLAAELEENTERTDLTPEEAVLTTRRIEAMVKKAAKERQKEHGKTAPGKPKNTSGKLPEVKQAKGDSRDMLGAAVGLSGKTLEKAAAVIAGAEKKPELRPIVDQMNRTGNVNGAFKKLVAAVTPPAEKEAKAQERGRNLWGKTFDEILLLVNSFDRGGGVGGVMAGWERDRIGRAMNQADRIIAGLQSLRDEMEGLLR